MNFNQIKEKISQDPRNESYTARGIPPILQIDQEARILIIGQAPGAKVEQSGIPFDDRSGKILREWMGITSAVFYSPKVAIMPMDFYFPGKGKSGDLPPRKFMKEYHQEIRKLMPHIELTILVGKYAIDAYLKPNPYKSLTETVHHFYEFLPQYFPIVHPSPLNYGWQKKNPWFKEEVVPILKERIHAILSSDQ